MLTSSYSAIHCCI